MKNNAKPVSRNEDIVVQELNGEVLIYDLRENRAFCLNETAGLVWQKCNGQNTVSEITGLLSKQLDSPATHDLVWLALDQLKKENLIENNDEIVGDFNGMSRREVVRKLGLGSMIALPIVASLVVPSSALAQGSCTPGGDCTCTGPNVGQGTVCTPRFSTCNPGCVCRFANNGNNNLNGVCGPP